MKPDRLCHDPPSLVRDCWQQLPPGYRSSYCRSFFHTHNLGLCPPQTKHSLDVQRMPFQQLLTVLLFINLCAAVRRRMLVGHHNYYYYEMMPNYKTWWKTEWTKLIKSRKSVRKNYKWTGCKTDTETHTQEC